MSLEVSVDLQEVVVVQMRNMESYEIVDARVTSDGETRVTSDGSDRVVDTGNGMDEFITLDFGEDMIVVEI